MSFPTTKTYLFCGVFEAVFKGLSKELSDCNAATLVDWFKNLPPVYQPIRREAQTDRDLHTQLFTRSEKVTWNNYEFGLVHGAVCTCCDWSK